jgi:signal recognition particle GTPase
MQEEFGFNNPFERNSVGEEEIWAEGEEGFQDVDLINRSAFKILTDDIESVRGSKKHTTKVRFMVGTSGAGKSHLFSRLRRWLEGQAIFIYASIPPQRSDGILPWTLKKVFLGCGIAV